MNISIGRGDEMERTRKTPRLCCILNFLHFDPTARYSLIKSKWMSVQSHVWLVNNSSCILKLHSGAKPNVGNLCWVAFRDACWNSEADRILMIGLPLKGSRRLWGFFVQLVSHDRRIVTAGFPKFLVGFCCSCACQISIWLTPRSYQLKVFNCNLGSCVAFSYISLLNFVVSAQLTEFAVNYRELLT